MKASRCEFSTYEIMIPLSTENMSDGNPAMFQALILTGSPKVFVREKSSEQGISLILHTDVHSFV